MTKKWYFKYDPEKGNEFIPGAILSEEQPDNATDAEPTGFRGLPKWNESAHKWEGESLEDWLNNQKESAANYVDPNQKQLSDVTQIVMKQLAQQTAEITQLKAQIKGGN